MFAVVGGLLAINGTAAAMGQFDTLTQTFADFAGHAAGGDKAYAELDAATFAAQLQTGGSDYFFTMSMLDSLLQIEDNQ